MTVKRLFGLPVKSRTSALRCIFWGYAFAYRQGQNGNLISTDATYTFFVKKTRPIRRCVRKDDHPKAR